jgi:hypothetical protein
LSALTFGTIPSSAVIEIRNSNRIMVANALRLDKRCIVSFSIKRFANMNLLTSGFRSSLIYANAVKH